jgi:tRNA nucleotidyltransferase (CCA-adding enzyme)
MELYIVGGYVRDLIMGRVSKDIDFSVVLDNPARDPFATMRAELVARGFDIFTESPQFLTIRARAPKDFLNFGNVPMRSDTFDFVLARSESDYTDGRRPDRVTPGSLYDDLARRDFTMNAIAIDANGAVIDYFNGQRDIEDRLIRTVGDPIKRFNEDRLRILRAVRFAVTLDFRIDINTGMVISRFGSNVSDTFQGVSVERIREELERAFKHDTLETLSLLDCYNLTEKVFRNGLRLSATMKG